ncbi:MAG: ADP-glyceromanno-heptose 6-epimerase, partial [Chitinophagaceae bacterium]|nr:ADP-glyceromanno-heptose 6-epimerase [Chitinophagaceae bacterium]
MDKQSKIMITGAAGFIASYLAAHLNKLGYDQLYLVDDFTIVKKQSNFLSLNYIEKIQRDDLESYLKTGIQPDYMIHLGARTDTTEMDYAIHEKLNVAYSKFIWTYCSLRRIPLIYASSAATYGNGEFGYNDTHEIVDKLQPLNPYGISKNEFDKWVLKQVNEKALCPPNWQGLKFFNVYGPHESHKGRMASVIFHAFHQIKKQGAMNLFRSHHPDYTDGGQLRDFIYVRDIAEVIVWLMEKHVESGLYNLGTGHAETFLHLAQSVFDAMGKPAQIHFIDTPIDIRDKYQYFTEANMQKLIRQGYSKPFTRLADGVKDYVT